MTKIDQIIADALAGSPETHVAILAREVVRLREAPAVVVPPGDTFTLDLDEFGKNLARITINSKNRGIGYQLCGTMGDSHFSRRTFDVTPYLGHCLNLIGIHAIPAHRVLGEGMAEELRLLRDALVELCDSQLSSRDREGAIARGLAALRANQGGADHD